MKIKRIKPYIIASAIIALSISLYFLIRSKLVNDPEEAHFIIGTLYSFLVSISIFCVNVNFVKLLQTRFPWGRKKDTIIRAVSEFIITNIFAAIIVSLYALLFAWFFWGANHYKEDNLPLLFFQNIIIAIIMNTIAISIFEGAYMFRQWREALLNSEKLNLFIPPLSLQLLFENAVKHNVISSSNPLVVELYDEGEYLIMKNKIRRKNNVEQRPGTGLKNLSERYSYLEAEKPEFYIKNNYYIATVPLIKDEN